MATRDSLTILHCLAPATIGGLESVVRALTTGHQALGHRVIVAAAVDGTGQPFVTGLRGQGIEVSEIHASARDFRKERHAIEDIIRSERPDVVHTHGYRPDILDLPVAKRLRVPTVSSLHGFTGGNWKLRLYERLQIRSIRHADAITAASRGVYDRVRVKGIPERKLHLIHNAYAATTPLKDRSSARGTLNIHEPEFRIGWIGRLSHEKGADVMLDAMAELHDTPISLSIIGDGAERLPLASRIDAMGLGHRIIMHGAVADAAQLLPAFDAFVLSSRTEGTPMVILETMSAGVPIIATNVGGIPEMLSNDEALLVTPENPAALARAIRSLYENMPAAHARAERARERVTRDFGIEPWLARYETLYRSLR